MSTRKIWNLLHSGFLSYGIAPWSILTEADILARRQIEGGLRIPYSNGISCIQALSSAPIAKSSSRPSAITQGSGQTRRAERRTGTSDCLGVPAKVISRSGAKGSNNIFTGEDILIDQRASSLDSDPIDEAEVDPPYV
jgi:hypothetical protein